MSQNDQPLRIEEQPFAIADVLGFSSLVASRPLQEVYGQYTMLFLNASVSGAMLRRHAPQFIIVSDTVFVFPARRLKYDTYATSFKALVRYLCQLVHNSIAFGLPIRAALSSGCLLADRKHRLPRLAGSITRAPIPLVLGRPVVDADRWEKQQKWVGASMDPVALATIREERSAVLAELQEDHYLLQWDVPTANGIVPTLALNFVHESTATTLHDLLDKAERDACQQPAVAAKYRAARLFLEYVSRERRFCQPPISRR